MSIAIGDVERRRDVPRRGAQRDRLRSRRGSLLGLGEAGNFPAGIKTIAEWFPKRERAFAAGLMNAGSNVGAVITPLLVPVLVLGVRLAIGVRRHRRGRLRLAGGVAG